MRGCAGYFGPLRHDVEAVLGVAYRVKGGGGGGQGGSDQGGGGLVG